MTIKTYSFIKRYYFVLENLYKRKNHSCFEEKKMIRKHGIYFLIIVILSTSFLFSQQAEDRALKNIGFQKIGNQVEVSVEYEGNVDFESFILFGPNRLVVDLPGIDRVSSSTNVGVNEMGITSIRSVLHSPGVVRVVLDFSDKISQYKIEDSENGLKIFFWKEADADSIPVEDVEAVKEKTEQPVPAVVRPEVSSKEAQEEKFAKSDTEMKKVGIGFSVGSFALKDEVFEEVYGKGGIYYSAELSFVLPFSAKYLDVWTSVSQFQKDGKSTAYEEDTRLKITVFSVALRYLINSAKLTPFFGLGMDYYSYKETLPEGFIVPSVGGYDLGFHLQGGVYFRFTPGFLAKLFFKYNIAKTMENDIDVNMGGMQWALSLIFQFNLERN